MLSLDVIAALAGAAALLTWLSGGFRFDPWGMRISSSEVHRPLVIGAAAWLVARALAGDAARNRLCLTPAAVPCAALALTVFSLWHAAPYAAAADMYGYVSQAADWRAGTLVHPDWAVAPPGFPPDAAIPLGYVFRREPVAAAVALYPPGLPLHMAAASLIAPRATYLVSPLAAVALVFGTAALGRTWWDARAARWAAVLVAFSPVVLAQAVVPMSDTLAAAYWTWAFVLSRSERTGGHAAAGGLAGVAIAVRPSLAPLIAPLLVASAATAGWRSLLAVAAGAAPFVAALAFHNARLYGSAFATGYGETDQLFALANVGDNLRNYGSWLAATSSPLLLVGVVAGAGWAMRQPRHLPMVALVALTTLIHLLYLPWPNWTFMRFLLPALPAMVLMAVALASRVTHRHTWILPVLGLVVLGWQMEFTHRSEIRDARPAMARFESVATHLKAARLTTSPIVTRLHSGSLRYYADARQAVRWDLVSVDELRTGIQQALDAGLQPLLVDDVDDRADFEARFGPIACWADESEVLFAIDAPARVRVLRARAGC